MKKYPFLIFLSLLNFLLVAQPSVEPTGVSLTRAVEPPSIVLSKFNYDHPNVNPVWSMGDSLYSAQYRDESSNLGSITRYDRNGNVISRENELENNRYPVSIAKYFAKKYPDEKFSIWSYENKGNKTYYISREDETLWFNGSGRFTRSVKKENFPR